MQDTSPQLIKYEALLALALAVLAVTVTYHVAQLDRPQPRQAAPEPLNVAGMIEAQSLTVKAKSRDFLVTTQGTEGFTNGRWTGKEHLFLQTKDKGDWIDWQLPTQAAGRYALTGYFSRSYDYAQIQLKLNGQNIGAPVDLWAWTIESTGPIELGDVTLTGTDVLRLEVVGHNEKAVSPFMQTGLDGFVLTKK